MVAVKSQMSETHRAACIVKDKGLPYPSEYTALRGALCVQPADHSQNSIQGLLNRHDQLHHLVLGAQLHL